MIILAVVVCAWFALGIRQTRDTARATAIIASAASANGPSAAQASQERSLLRAAGTLNPDKQLDVLRGQLALLQGNNRSATRILEGVVAQEPLNVEAWVYLARAAFNVNRHEFGIAAQRIAQLDPPQK
jgi:predicted Zn-dependent protease